MGRIEHWVFALMVAMVLQVGCDGEGRSLEGDAGEESGDVDDVGYDVDLSDAGEDVGPGVEDVEGVDVTDDGGDPRDDEGKWAHEDGRWPAPENVLTIPLPDEGGGYYAPDIQERFPEVDWSTLDRLYLPAGHYKFIQIGNLPERSPERPLSITNQGGQVRVGGLAPYHRA